MSACGCVVGGLRPEKLCDEATALWDKVADRSKRLTFALRYDNLVPLATRLYEDAQREYEAHIEAATPAVETERLL